MRLPSGDSKVELYGKATDIVKIFVAEQLKIRAKKSLLK